MHRRLSDARHVVRLNVLVVFAALACFGAGQPSAQAEDEQPRGLLYFASYAQRDNTAPVANPHLLGALFTIYWSDVEKSPGECDWSAIEGRMKPWIAAGKKIALRIMWSSSGNWPEPAAKTPTPQFVLDEGAVTVHSDSSRTDIPLTWDPIYRRHAQRFLAEVARKFDGDPNILFVDVTPGAETNPYRFRRINVNEPQFKQRFAGAAASDGRVYSHALWLETVKQCVDDAVAAFKQTPLLVTLNVGSLDGPEQFLPIGTHCVEHGCYVGQNGLNARSYLDDSPRKRAFTEWDKSTQLYFEMVDASGGNTGSLLDVMKAAERIGCDYLGVYAVDVLRGTRGQANYDPAYEDALAYGAKALGGSEAATEGGAQEPSSERGQAAAVESDLASDDGPLVYEDVPDMRIPRLPDGLHLPFAVSGRVVKIDLAARTIELQAGFPFRSFTPDPQSRRQIRLADGAQLFVENEAREIDEMNVGDPVNVWLHQFSPAEDGRQLVADSIHLLRGIDVGDGWLPEIRRRPDASGMLFFDDFESGDFRKWQYRSGTASILSRDRIAGDYSFTANRHMREVMRDGMRQRGTTDDFVVAMGFPQVEEIWLKWKFQHAGVPAETGNYAIFRPYYSKGAQLFAVRIVPPRDGRGWRLACQTEGAQDGAEPVGTINLEPDRTYELKMQWKRASSDTAYDGTVRSWVDGQLDIDLEGKIRTRARNKFDMLWMGMLHSGTPASGGTIVIDDVWVGMHDPDASDN